MIGYATVGSNDFSKSLPFYDGVMQEMGAGPIFDHPRGGRMYGTGGKFQFGVISAYDGSPASVGNGTMIALAADTHDQIRAVHAKALELGGTDEGEPGWRGAEGGFFGAYFRDTDGNKLCVYRMGPA